MPELDFRAPRLYVDAPLHAGQTVELARDQSNYLGNVLRLASGDTILVFNGRDGEWTAEIATGPPARPHLRLCAAQTCPPHKCLNGDFAPFANAARRFYGGVTDIIAVGGVTDVVDSCRNASLPLGEIADLRLHGLGALMTAR